MAQHYTPNRMVVFCQGNVKPDKIFRIAEREFGKLENRQSTDSQPTVKANVTPLSERERSFKKHTLGGGSLNSRLNLSLRESKGLVYTVESTYTPLSDTGYWCIYWACDPEDYDYSLGLVRHELDKFRTTPLTESGLKHALEQLRGQLAISAQNQENSALALAKSMLYHGCAPLWQETFDKIAQTSAQDLSNVANELFCDENCYILTYI